MKAVFTITFTLFYSILFCQKDDVGIDFSKNGNSVYLKLKQEREIFYALKNLNIIESQNVIRFWDTNNCIEINSIGNKNYGKIYFAIKNTDKENDFLRQEVSLTEEQTLKIIELYQKLNIENIPTDEKIIGWTNGFDGRIYQIEKFTKNKYSLKSFWTPSIQQVEEAKIILNFWSKLDEIISVTELFKQFISQNKFTCYKYYGTSYSICTILTKKEARKLKRQKRKI